MNAIPALTQITTHPDIAAAERIQKFLHLDGLPVSRLTAEDKAWLEEYEAFLFEGQMVTFRGSIDAGETDTHRRAYFGLQYEALKRAYDMENAECRVCGDHVETLDKDEDPQDALCSSCNHTLNRQQERDYQADGKR